MPPRPARATARGAPPRSGELTPGAWEALALAAALAAAAWWARTLSLSGALAATLVGAATLLGAGWWGGALLLTFFVGSTLVSRLCPDPAAARGEAKGGRRDAGQVIANGGLPALGALAGLHSPGLGLWALAAGLAAAAADTWATAIGATSPAPPRHILTGRIVTAGTSGGVTWRGTFGAAAGAATVTLVALLPGERPMIALVAWVAGVSGMLLDSLLGATVQGRFRCPACAVTTERRIHRCGTRATRVGGIAWISNDSVNAVATLAATIAGLWWGATWR